MRGVAVAGGRCPSWCRHRSDGASVPVGVSGSVYGAVTCGDACRGAVTPPAVLASAGVAPRLVTLLWRVLGFKLAWKKGHAGTAVPWVGVALTVDSNEGVVVVSLPAEKRKEALEDVRALLAQRPKVRRRDLRTTTGRLEWAAGLLPQLRPFAQMLWAALTSEGAGSTHVFLRQIALALQWFAAFLDEGSGLITRRIRADAPNTRHIVSFDASVFGGGLSYGLCRPI